ncbi:hypothetical protein [Pulveribacter sp.]|uniref:hypothetical protein n=1 Tax=Pulveribacter sp. TaxID=2678893 RepID=UPI00289FC10A|nr:hypothetical protein [Pulveribacter sp.]
MEENELPDLASFRREVAMCPNGVKSIHNDLKALHRYVGLPSDTGSFRRRDVEACLLEGIAASFQAGHRQAVQYFGSLRREILYAHVLDGTPLGADFAVACILVDALRPTQGRPNVAPDGDWRLAVQRAVEYETLHIEDYSTHTSHVQTRFRRDLEVARAALRLRDRGYMLRREPGKIFLEPADEDRLVDRLQRIVALFPGFRVLRNCSRFSPLCTTADRRDTTTEDAHPRSEKAFRRFRSISCCSCARNMLPEKSHIAVTRGRGASSSH